MVICPPTVITPDQSLKKECHMDNTRVPIISEEARRLADLYPVQQNNDFSVLRDSVSVACLFTKAGTVHAYMTDKEATATARHFFAFAVEECNESMQSPE